MSLVKQRGGVAVDRVVVADNAHIRAVAQKAYTLSNFRRADSKALAIAGFFEL